MKNSINCITTSKIQITEYLGQKKSITYPLLINLKVNQSPSNYYK